MKNHAKPVHGTAEPRSQSHAFIRQEGAHPLLRIGGHVEVLSGHGKSTRTAKATSIVMGA